MEAEKLNALREKKAENIDKAKKHLALMKQYQNSLEEQYKLYPFLRPAAQVAKIEEKTPPS